MEKSIKKINEDTELMHLEEWKVYKHTSPSNKVYIGITHQKPEERWRGGKGYQYNYHFWNAIQKYGWDNFDHEIIAEGLTEEEATKMEKKLVAQYNSASKYYGYNIAEGGHVLSKESRAKIGRTRREKGIPSPNKGKKHSAETRAKISAAKMGTHWNYTLTDEQRERRSLSKRGAKNPNYGKPMPEIQKQLLIALNERAVIQIVNGCEVHYRSAKEAEKQTGICSCNITRVCRGQRETAGGFVWKYAT